MATDLTGAPTSQGIGTYNTSADAPSGLGFNAAMAQIDALFAARTKALTATGDLLYASAANTPARLPIGTTGQILSVVGGLPTWSPAAGAVTLRKVTSKTVNTTVAATDLLNGEISVAANSMGATGLLRLTAFGDWLQNSGGNAAPPRLQLVFGGTTLMDTGAGAGLLFTTSANREGWKIVAEIFNTATGAQVVNFRLDMATGAVPSTSGSGAFTTGEGVYQDIAAGGNLTGQFAIAEGYNASAVDTTATKTLVLNVINGSASATYEVVLKGALVEII